MTVDHEGLAGIHAHVRRLLAEFDRVATEQELPYFLAYGTALGAVRGGDLIPWDVDADVWVPREHYRRLVEEVGPRVGPGFELLAPETHAGYEYLFPRLTVRGTHHALLSLDVFPLDPAPASVRAGAGHLRVARLLAQVFFVKRADPTVRAHYSWRKRLVARLLRVVAAPLPARTLLSLFRRLQGRHEGRGSGVLMNSCGSYGARELFDARWFEAAESRPVGGQLLPVPGGYDALLTQLYGDYRQPPPELQQRRELEFATATFVAPLRRCGALPARPTGSS